MIMRIGHRGAAGHEPENTLRSFERAIALGVDLVEFDVQLTSDGHLVLMHDKRVDRTTNGRGYLSDMTLAELQALDAGKGEKIPTLKDVLRLTSHRVGLMLEIITPGIAEQIVRAVEESYEGQVIYASFLHAEVAEVKRLSPDASTLALIEAVPVRPTDFAKDANVTHVGLSVDSTTSHFVSALHEEGFKVFIYTVNDPRDIFRLRSLNVDGLISDYPERLQDSGDAATSPQLRQTL
jgi:glycerophosphoryl diester phosphodiesterase